VVDSVRAQLEQQGAMIERLQGQLTTDGAGGGANDVTRRQLEVMIPNYHNEPNYHILIVGKKKGIFSVILFYL